MGEGVVGGGLMAFRKQESGSANRGFAAVALVSPKCDANVGGVLRAAYCYDAAMVILQRPRTKPTRLFNEATNVNKTQRHIPSIVIDDLFDALPYDCVPIAVDLVQGAKSLPNVRHPERAMYIFGPEDGTLGKQITDRCAMKIMVPTVRCMNLAATVNVILYDRLSKQVCA